MATVHCSPIFSQILMESIQHYTQGSFYHKIEKFINRQQQGKCGRYRPKKHGAKCQSWCLLAETFSHTKHGRVVPRRTGRPTPSLCAGVSRCLLCGGYLRSSTGEPDRRGAALLEGGRHWPLASTPLSWHTHMTSTRVWLVRMNVLPFFCFWISASIKTIIRKTFKYRSV